MVVVLYSSYISLVKIAIDAHSCITVHDGATAEEIAAGKKHRYWALDTSIRCYGSQHLTFVRFVSVPLALFAVAFPLFIAIVLLFARRNGKLSALWMQDTLGFLYNGFEEKYVYWDSVILLRKAALTAIAVFAYNLGGNLQSVLAATLLLFCLFLQAIICPFKRQLGYLNRLESISLLVSCLTFLFGVVINDPAFKWSFARDFLFSMLLICNIGLAGFLLYALVRVRIEKVRLELQQEGIDCGNGSFVAVHKAYVGFYADKLIKWARNETMGSDMNRVAGPSAGPGIAGPSAT